MSRASDGPQVEICSVCGDLEALGAVLPISSWPLAPETIESQYERLASRLQASTWGHRAIGKATDPPEQPLVQPPVGAVEPGR
jgi:hypothetical protein